MIARLADGCRFLFKTLRHEYFLWALIALLLILTAFEPTQSRRYPTLVDWPTIATLTGLLILTKGIELSGYLNAVARRLMTHLHSQRQLALFLVAGSALLSTVLTNDIALFIVVPLTLSLKRLANLPIARLIAFEALAVNAGSTLTPIGNPQNLFLWRVADVSFLRFTWHMAPLVAALLCLLLVATALCFGGKRIDASSEENASPGEKKLLLVSLALYLPFIVATDLHWPAIALSVVLLIFVLGFRRVLARVDWVLIAVFILMFIDLRLIADLSWLRGLLRRVRCGPGVASVCRRHRRVATHQQCTGGDIARPVLRQLASAGLRR